VLLATLANTLGYMDRVCMSIVSPRLRVQFGFSAGEIGMIFGAFSLSYALFQTPWGMVADRRSARTIVAVVILMWSVSTGLTALSTSLAAFLVVRFVFGASEAALSPTIASLFRRSLSFEHRPTAFGIFLAGGRIGGLVAPSIAAFFVIRYGWQSVFVLFAFIGVAAVVIWLLAFPKQVPQRADKPKASRKSPQSASLLILVLVALLYTMMWQFFVTWFPTYLMESRRFSLQRAGFFAGLPFLFGVGATLAGGPLNTFIARFLGPVSGRRILVAGSLLLSAALLYSGLVQRSATAGAVLISLAAGAGDLILSTLWAAAVDLGEDSAGAVSGLMNTAANLGAFLSPVLIGRMLQSGLGWSLIVEAGALLNFCAAVLWLFFRPRIPVKATP
jgi:ACS family glucarate transporter-like MFS transporter